MSSNSSPLAVDAFRNMFAILHNLETSDLPFLSAEQRQEFFRDPVPTILRIDDARLDALYALVQSKRPARYKDRPIVAEQQGGGSKPKPPADWHAVLT